MEYVQLKTKQDFKKAKEKYISAGSEICWKMYMWDFFRSKTCYIPQEDCFISLDKAQKIFDQNK
jgi:hypothetical protein